MHRILFYIPFSRMYESWPDVPVYSYGFMMMLAFLSALFLATRRARKDGIEEDAIMNLAFLCIASGIIGSRMLYVILFAGPEMPVREWFAIWHGGLVYYGGLILGLVFGSAYIYYKRLPWGKVADCFAPGLAVGIGFGRIGCFLNGCCHGATCAAESWFAVRFPVDSPAADQQAMDQLLAFGQAPLPVWPSQLIESASGFLIFGVIMWCFPKRRFSGQMMLLFVMLYAVARFMVEFVRADTPFYGGIPGTWDGLKAGQIVAILTFIPAVYLYRRLGKRTDA